MFECIWYIIRMFFALTLNAIAEAWPWGKDKTPPRWD